MTLRAIWIARIAALAACSKPAPPIAPAPASAPVAPTLDQDLPQLVERSLALYRDVATAFAAAGTDCAAATTKLGELTPRYRDVAVANAKVVHDGRLEQLRAAIAPHEADFDSVAQAVMQSHTLESCVRDPAFYRAFGALFDSP